MATPSSPSRPSSRASKLRAPSPLQRSHSSLAYHRDSLPSPLGRPESRRSDSRQSVSIIDDAISEPLLPHSATSLEEKLKRRSAASLASIAGEGSMLPLPVSPPRNGKPLLLNYGEDTIMEGIPTSGYSTFGEEDAYDARRSSSPTRTLSRIPLSAVGHARALAEDSSFENRSFSNDDPNSSILSLGSSTSSRPSLGPLPPLSPNPSLGSSTSPNRRSMMPNGSTTKVLADLQAGVVNARNALENTKAQLRLSQRSVAQLTRQTEDLKDGRERLRLENEGLNQVVSRKERLLQEVLERARKAEAEAATLKASLKSATVDSKKSLREMEATVSQATLTSQRSEREYITLKDSVKSMLEGWQREAKSLRDEVRQKEEKWNKEREEVGVKYKSLLKLIQASKTERQRLEGIKSESSGVDASFAAYLQEEIDRLKSEIAKTAGQSEKDSATVEHVASELTRIRRLMRDTKPPSD